MGINSSAIALTPGETLMSEQIGFVPIAFVIQNVIAVT